MDPLQQIIVEDQRWRDKHHPHRIRKGKSAGWALHLRRTFPMLEDTMDRAERVFPEIDPYVFFESQKHRWVFSSGFKFQFGHCKDPGDWQQYFSKEYTHLAMDEVIQFEKEQYMQISSRVRSVDPVLRTMLKTRAMSNPVVMRGDMENITLNDPMWVRKYFVEPAPRGFVELFRTLKSPRDGRQITRTRIFLPATLYDHPDPEFIKQYEGTLLDKPKHMVRALLFGDWDYVAGAFFDGWDPAIHVCRAFKIPDDWRRFRSMDWGFKSPGCVHWWAMDHEGNLVCEREMTFKEQSATMIAHAIKKVEMDLKLWGPNGSEITGPADTQLWERRGDHVQSKAEEMMKVGVRWVAADKKARTRNAELMQGRISDYARNGGDPGIVFFEKCVMVIRSIPRVMASPLDPNTPVDATDDHHFDSALYACAYASRGTKGVPQRPEKRYHDDNMDDLFEERGALGYGDMY
jgi:hypothetical protein